MNKNTLIIRSIVLVVLVLSVTYGIHYADVNKPLNNSEECSLSASGCTFIVEHKTISLFFEQAPITEEELFIQFKMPPEFQIKKAWVEGVNMYMGKTPILFENKEMPSRGVTFLGSCNLAEMQWMLYVELEGLDADANSIILSATFSTYL